MTLKKMEVRRLERYWEKQGRKKVVYLGAPLFAVA